MKAPINLRLELEPYPHLRDDEGCVLARDYQDLEKLEFIVAALDRFEIAIGGAAMAAEQFGRIEQREEEDRKRL